jgi:hypothetical protein
MPMDDRLAGWPPTYAPTTAPPTAKAHGTRGSVYQNPTRRTTDWIGLDNILELPRDHPPVPTMFKFSEGNEKQRAAVSNYLALTGVRALWQEK